MVVQWVDSQGSSLEGLELGPAEACSLGPEDPGFWIPCIFESLAAQPMTYRLASSHKSSGGGELMVSSLLPAGLPSPSIAGGGGVSPLASLLSLSVLSTDSLPWSILPPGMGWVTGAIF